MGRLFEQIGEVFGKILQWDMPGLMKVLQEPEITTAAFIALAVTGAPFGFMAFLGVASLVGVIVSHVIVLFDFIEEMHEKGEPFEQAIRDAGIERLRPVLITVCATILALLPLSGLAGLSASPDGALVLAPEGVSPEFALPGNVPLLGVVRDRWLPSSPRVSPPSITVPVADEPRRGLRLVLAALVVAAAVGGWSLLARARESIVAPPAPPVAPPTSSTISTTSRPSTNAPPKPVAVPRDTLGWTIQLAAYASLDKALAHADRLAADAGVPALVTPAPQSGNGPVWYRVLAGSYATRAAAGSARAGLWRRGIAGEGVGDLLLAPYSYHAPAGASLDTLRRRGLPAVRWSNGVILLGAFETPEQAAYTQAALKRARVRANLLPRMGAGGAGGGGPP